MRNKIFRRSAARLSVFLHAEIVIYLAAMDADARAEGRTLTMAWWWPRTVRTEEREEW